jgi:hypothetical protein
MVVSGIPDRISASLETGSPRLLDRRQNKVADQPCNLRPATV